MSKNRDDLIVNVLEKVNSVVPLDMDAIKKNVELVDAMNDEDKTVNLGVAMYIAENLPLILYGLVTNAAGFRQYMIVSCSKYVICEGNIQKLSKADNKYNAVEIKNIMKIKASHQLKSDKTEDRELAIVGKKEFEPEVYDNLSMMIDDSWSHFDMDHLAALVRDTVDPGLVTFLTSFLSNYKWLVYMAVYDGVFVNILEKVNWRENMNIS